MYMSDQQKLSEARILASTLDRLTRHPKRISPSAPWIIPATMIFVASFAVVCLVIKLIMYYLNAKHERSKKFALSGASSPEIPTTPEDQSSMATTASMKIRGSMRVSGGGRGKRSNKQPPVSLYTVKQKQSPGTATPKNKGHKGAMRALARAARHDANLSRSSSRRVDDNSDDNTNNAGDNSPTNLSQRSDDTDELQASASPSGLAYSTVTGRGQGDDINQTISSNQQPQVHIVQIRDLDDHLQHSEPWPQTESDI